jgi:cytochrome aa3-600 menaquinol oxidase subunit 3
MSALPKNEAMPGLPPEFADEAESLRITGFWLFLVTDLLVFASLFASYAVYRPLAVAGPPPASLFHLGPVLAETLILLTSSFTVAIATWQMRWGAPPALAFWLLLTLLLGLSFVLLEVHEFAGDLAIGAGWQGSSFLSSFFLLVATHGAHVSFGILWALALLFQLRRRGLTPTTARKLYTFALYWHFLDIVWVFIFTFVYLGGRIL